MKTVVILSMVIRLFCIYGILQKASDRNSFNTGFCYDETKRFCVF